MGWINAVKRFSTHSPFFYIIQRFFLAAVATAIRFSFFHFTEVFGLTGNDGHEIIESIAIWIHRFTQINGCNI